MPRSHFTMRNTIVCAGFVAMANASAIHAGHTHRRRSAAHHAHEHAGRTHLPPPSLSARDYDFMSVHLINNMESDDVHVYLTTSDMATQQSVLIDSKSNIFTPSSGTTPGVPEPIPEEAGCGIKLGPKGTTKTINLPLKLASARAYASIGEMEFGILPGPSLVQPSFSNPSDPNANISYGFVEASQPETCLFANPSYCDFVGLPMAMEVHTSSEKFEMGALPSSGREEICDKLAEEEQRTGAPWSGLCKKDSDGAILRILSPGHLPELNDYFTDYIDAVWRHIAANGLDFLLQDGSGTTTCSLASKNAQMVCDGIKDPFPKPKSTDIWGCTGQTVGNWGDAKHSRVAARFCAAFHRATFLLDGGGTQPQQPVSAYYPLDARHNSYSRIVHEVMPGGLGYTFPYDDVTPDDDDNVSGTLAVEEPKVLKIFIGGKAGSDGGTGGESGVSKTTGPASVGTGPAASSTTTILGGATTTADATTTAPTTESTDTPTTEPTTFASPTQYTNVLHSLAPWASPFSSNTLKPWESPSPSPSSPPGPATTGLGTSQKEAGVQDGQGQGMEGNVAGQVGVKQGNADAAVRTVVETAVDFTTEIVRVTVTADAKR